MNKKLGELSRKVRHSEKKHDGLIHKRNSLKIAIEEFTWGSTKQPAIEPAQGFMERERAFQGAYRSYGVKERSRMDVDNFLSHRRGEIISLINRELTDLNSARVETTKWIMFIQEFDDVVEDDRVELAFNRSKTLHC